MVSGALRETLNSRTRSSPFVILGYNYGLRAGCPAHEAGGLGGSGEGHGRAAAVSRDDENVAVGVAAIPVEGDVTAVRREVGGGDFREVQELLEELVMHGGDSTICEGIFRRLARCEVLRLDLIPSPLRGTCL